MIDHQLVPSGPPPAAVPDVGAAASARVSRRRRSGWPPSGGRRTRGAGRRGRSGWAASRWWVVVLALVVVGADQVTKLVAAHPVVNQGADWILPRWVSALYQGHRSGRVLDAVDGGLLAGAWRALLRCRWPAAARAGVTLALAGLLSNLLGRLGLTSLTVGPRAPRGAVDWFVLGPTGNLADLAIAAGGLVLVVSALYGAGSALAAGLAPRRTAVAGPQTHRSAPPVGTPGLCRRRSRRRTRPSDQYPGRWRGRPAGAVRRLAAPAAAAVAVAVLLLPWTTSWGLTTWTVQMASRTRCPAPAPGLGYLRAVATEPAPFPSATFEAETFAFLCLPPPNARRIARYDQTHHLAPPVVDAYQMLR